MWADACVTYGVQHSDAMEAMQHAVQHAERAALFVQLLSPPLPILCRGSDGEERITSSHDLLNSMFGRLVCVPADKFVGAYAEDGFAGDWKSHVLRGKHAINLLETLVGVTKQFYLGDPELKLTKNVAVDQMYGYFCTYLREIINLTAGYDTFVMGNKTASSSDVRFLCDVGRVNVVHHATLVLSTLDFYCALLVFRGEKTDKMVKTLRTRMHRAADYHYTLYKCMDLLRSVAEQMLHEEKNIPKLKN